MHCEPRRQKHRPRAEEIQYFWAIKLSYIVAAFYKLMEAYVA
jgi:hypothetical protein